MGPFYRKYAESAEIRDNGRLQERCHSEQREGPPVENRLQQHIPVQLGMTRNRVHLGTAPANSAVSAVNIN